jgi:hypothetical protein
VQVKHRRLRHLVPKDDANLVARVDPELGTGDLAVVAHRLHDHARLRLPPELLRHEVEDLGAVLDPGLERLVAKRICLCREREDAGLVALEHLLGRHVLRARLVSARGVGREVAPGHDRQRAGHPRALVPGDRAEDPIVAGLEGRDLEHRALAGFQQWGLLNADARIDSNVCAAEPSFLTSNTRSSPAGASIRAGEIANSVSVTSNSAAPSPAGAPLDGPPSPPVHAVATSTSAATEIATHPVWFPKGLYSIQSPCERS